MEIIALLQPVNHLLDKTTMRQLVLIVNAMIAMTGRVTMLGISRWTEKGGSYRTIQRFFQTTIEWSKLNWHLFLEHRYTQGEYVAMAGDHTVVTKSGKQTHGLGYFFSSIQNKPVKGLEFFSLSMINISRRESTPILMEQTIRVKSNVSENEEVSTAPAEKRKRGRPKGSKNKNHRDIKLPAHLEVIQKHIASTLAMIGQKVHVRYMLLDGAFGNNNAVQMSRRCSLHLISKLRFDAALYYPYKGPQKRRKYGEKVNPHQISEHYLVSQIHEDEFETRIYGFQARSKKFPDLLNIAVIQRINHKTNKICHVILFSSDLDLDTKELVDFYALRFQIEFNFRDAKQFWGLEDFMNTKETHVNNAANLAMFMVNASHALSDQMSASESSMSILDLKSYFRGRKYVKEVLKYLPNKPDVFLIETLFAKVGLLGSINCLNSP